ncbi:hypothetical protein ABDK56_00810 [Sphingomonas sp. ASV193]|uniref:hypothetical protein n=1 Tax=Sphingomonas sp. ASV193 TaxID=3144405 RepID=UPI0032E86CCC
MSASPFDQALDRCERALLRIERAAAAPRPAPAPLLVRDDRLRAEVAQVVAELDEILRKAAHA